MLSTPEIVQTSAQEAAVIQVDDVNHFATRALAAGANMPMDGMFCGDRLECRTC